MVKVFCSFIASDKAFLQNLSYKLRIGTFDFFMPEQQFLWRISIHNKYLD